MNILTKIAGKAIGKCIANGHRMEFKNYKFSYRSACGEGRCVYYMYFECSECGYKQNRYSTEKESAAIKVIENAEYKKTN